MTEIEETEITQDEFEIMLNTSYDITVNNLVVPLLPVISYNIDADTEVVKVIDTLIAKRDGPNFYKYIE